MHDSIKTVPFNTILVVDDSTANLRVLTNLLMKHGYTVHPASGGEKALEYVQSTLPGIILLDIQMPGMNGFEVCRRLKANERTRAIPVIFISVLEDEGGKLEGFRAGAADYITKPFQPEEILARIETHLHLRALTERLEQKVREQTQRLTIVNQRLQMEIAERQAVYENHRQREEELRSLLDNSPDMILKTDPHLRIIWANRTAMEMNPDCVGMPCYRAFPGRNEICEGCPVARAIETKRIERGVMFQPVSKTAPDEQYWENIGVPQFDHRGEVIACIEISRNITDRMKITRELEATNKDLEAFSYSVSHDLRAPLRHIDGFLELLEKKAGTALDEQGQHYLNNISDAAKKMGRMIDDLLSFSRMGRHELSAQKVALGELVRDILRELQPDIVGRTIDWQIGDLPAVQGEPAMLRMALFNLIANSLKFTRHRKKASIEIGSLPNRSAEAVIYVRDNGVGFDMAYRDRLFGVFQRLHREDEFDGTGIGLANVRRIITRHGGQTWAEGAPDRGATFYFSLKRTELGDGDAKTYAPQAGASGSSDPE